MGGFKVLSETPGNYFPSFVKGYHAEIDGHPFDVVITPQPISLPIHSKVVRVSAGRSHTLALTEEGQVFSIGNNAYGQCGRSIIEKEDYFLSRVIHNIVVNEMDSCDKIVDVTCGMDHR